MLAREHATQSPLKDVLSEPIGGANSDRVAEISTVKLEPGDALLLCTDGLTKHVSDERIVAALSEEQRRTHPSRRSRGGGARRWGADNVSVVVARCSD